VQVEVVVFHAYPSWQVQVKPWLPTGTQMLLNAPAMLLQGLPLQAGFNPYGPTRQEQAHCSQLTTFKPGDVLGNLQADCAVTPPQKKSTCLNCICTKPQGKLAGIPQAQLLLLLQSTAIQPATSIM
jgi:hypothetical protein